MLSTHVFGLGIDDEIHYQRPNATTDQDIWSHRDDLNSLTSITDDSGAVLERYEYGDYGQLRVLNASGVVQSGSQFDAAHVYTGRIVLPGTELYDYRNRVMDSELGRFIQIDPLGSWFDPLSRGNGYVYAGSMAYRYVDPFGYAAGDSGLKWYEWGGIVTNEEFNELIKKTTGASTPGSRGYEIGEELVRYQFRPEYPDDGMGPPLPATDSQGDCWRYVCDDPQKEGETHAGGGGLGKTPSCAALEAATGIRFTNDPCIDCGEGERRVAGEVHSESGDYHFYRQDDDGSWSHKPAAGYVRPVGGSGDPKDDPGYYDTFCGYGCLKKGHDTDAKP